MLPSLKIRVFSYLPIPSVVVGLTDSEEKAHFLSALWGAAGRAQLPVAWWAVVELLLCVTWWAVALSIMQMSF